MFWETQFNPQQIPRATPKPRPPQQPLLTRLPRPQTLLCPDEAARRAGGGLFSWRRRRESPGPVRVMLSKPHQRLKGSLHNSPNLARLPQALGVTPVLDPTVHGDLRTRPSHCPPSALRLPPPQLPCGVSLGASRQTLPAPKLVPGCPARRCVLGRPSVHLHPRPSGHSGSRQAAVEHRPPVSVSHLLARFDFAVCDPFRGTDMSPRQWTGFSHSVHPVSLRVNLLPGHSTVIKPGKFSWTRC